MTSYGPFCSYRARRTAKKFATAEIVRMITEKMNERAATERAAAIIFSSKKEGSLLFYVDYRKLNSVIIRDLYSLPRIDECIQILGEAPLFLSLATISRY